LLSEDINSLLAAVEKDQYDRAVAETTAAAAGSGAAAQRARRRRRDSGEQQAGQQGGQQGKGPRSSLWVDRYSPKGYIDLLSDEQINRCGMGRGPHSRPEGLVLTTALAQVHRA
jgi:hypothetical protein